MGFWGGIVDGGVGEGGVGEGRGCGFSEDDGRRIGMESFGRGFLTNFGDLIGLVPSTDSACSTIS